MVILFGWSRAVAPHALCIPHQWEIASRNEDCRVDIHSGRVSNWKWTFFLFLFLSVRRRFN
jgi:hypothetical protein